METITAAREILDAYGRTFVRSTTQQGAATVLACDLVRERARDTHAAGEAMDYLFSLGRPELKQPAVEKTLDALLKGEG